jgi:hypothetical protein
MVAEPTDPRALRLIVEAHDLLRAYENFPPDRLAAVALRALADLAELPPRPDVTRTECRRQGLTLAAVGLILATRGTTPMVAAEATDGPDL